MNHYRPDVFTKAALDNGWERYDQTRPRPYDCREWTFSVYLFGEPQIAHVVERRNGFPLVHHLDEYPNEYKVAVRRVESAMDKAEHAIYGTQNPPDKLPRLPAQYLRGFETDEVIPLQVLINLVGFFEKRAGMEIEQAKSGPLRDREKHRIYAGGWMKAARVLAKVSHNMVLNGIRENKDASH